jgi:hypothetical protein
MYTFTIECNSGRFQLPHGIRERVSFGSSVVALLSPKKENDQSSDVPYPGPERNVLCVDTETCGLEWTIEELPSKDRKDVYYSTLFVMNERLIARSTQDDFYEISTDSGEITDTWRATEFKVGGTKLQFENFVRSFIRCQEILLVQTSDGKSVQTHGIDSDGQILWKRDDVMDFKMKCKDGAVKLYDPYSQRGRTISLLVDRRTGDELNDSDGSTN